VTKDYLLVIDQSTSGTKALIADHSGKFIARASKEHKQYYPQPGWVEHDVLEIYENVKETIKDVIQLANISIQQLAGLTITNQRETAVLWDNNTGKPLYNAIVWQCQRTMSICEEWRGKGLEDEVKAKTGLFIDPYFSATKWRWLLDHASIKERDHMSLGTIDSWLLWKLTNGKVHATDYTNASRTMLFNLHSLDWDESLCNHFNIPKSMLPEIKASDDTFGYTEDLDVFGDVKIPITGIIGDSQAALLGNMCLEPGMVKATYGTGTSVLMNIGEIPVAPKSALVQTVAWKLQGKVNYALEAVIRSSGDTIHWIRDNLGIISSISEIEPLLLEQKENDGVYLIPAFVGLGAPYWLPEARATIVGINRGTEKAHIVRAAVESIAYQVGDAIELLEKESGITITKIMTDGGATKNSILMQFQSDIINKPILNSVIEELSALGSIYAGGLNVGFWNSLEEIADKKSEADRSTILPDMNEKDARDKSYAGWKKAVGNMIVSLEEKNNEV